MNRKDSDNSDKTPRSTNTSPPRYKQKSSTPSNPFERIVTDDMVGSAPNSLSVDIGRVKQKGMASVENTLNSMTGDISFSQLKEIPGISLMALKAKENVGEISIFQKKDYLSALKKYSPSEVSYQNIKLLNRFVAANGRIVPRRISNIDSVTQKCLERAIKIARYLALMPYIEH